MEILNRLIPSLIPATLLVGGIILLLKEDYIYGIYQIIISILGYLWYFAYFKTINKRGNLDGK